MEEREREGRASMYSRSGQGGGQEQRAGVEAGLSVNGWTLDNVEWLWVSSGIQRSGGALMNLLGSRGIGVS